MLTGSIRMSDAERVAARTAVRQDLPFVVASRAAVADALVRARAGPRGDARPRGAVPFVEVEVEVGAGRSGQDAAVRARDGRLVVRAVRLDRRSARAAERTAVGRAAAATAATGVGGLERDAAVRRVAVQTDVVISRDRAGDGGGLVVAGG